MGEVGKCGEVGAISRLLSWGRATPFEAVVPWDAGSCAEGTVACRSVLEALGLSGTQPQGEAAGGSGHAEDTWAAHWTCVSNPSSEGM